MERGRPLEPGIKNFEAKDGQEKREWRASDFRGFIHLHSGEGSSCGKEQMGDIVEAFKKKMPGIEFVAMSEHVGWPGEEYWEEKILDEFEEIDEINRESSMRVFKGIEANILSDGTIDASEELMKKSDFVVASHHYKNIETQDMSTAEVTMDRWISVMDNYPEVNVLGHPLRDLPEDEWANIEWDTVCQKAKEKNIVIEVSISDSAVDNLPDDFLEALVRNNNLVVIAPDFHFLVNPGFSEPGPSYSRSKKDNYLGHRANDLSEEQKKTLKRYYDLQSSIAGKTFKQGDVLKGRKPDEPELSEEKRMELVRILKKEREEFEKLRKSDELREIYDILLKTEKIKSTNGKEVEKYPLSPSTLLRFIRRIYKTRKKGLKSENIVNMWSKEQLEDWLLQRNKK